MDFFTELNPIVQALFATIFTWLLTAVGASFVFFMKTMSRQLLDLMLGFAAGVMIAASCLVAADPRHGLGRSRRHRRLGCPRWPVFCWAGSSSSPSTASCRTSTRGCPSNDGRGHRGLVEAHDAAPDRHHAPQHPARGLAVGVAFGAVAMEGGTDAGGCAGARPSASASRTCLKAPQCRSPCAAHGLSRSKSFFYGPVVGGGGDRSPPSSEPLSVTLATPAPALHATPSPQGAMILRGGRRGDPRVAAQREEHRLGHGRRDGGVRRHDVPRRGSGLSRLSRAGRAG